MVRVIIIIIISCQVRRMPLLIQVRLSAAVKVIGSATGGSGSSSDSSSVFRLVIGC